MMHEESGTQRACVSWFRMTHRRLALNLFSVPNGMMTSASQASIAKAEGLTAGVADLILLAPGQGFHGLCVEMKTPQGRQSAAQAQWQEAAEAQGYKYVVCRSFRQFVLAVREYLGEGLNESERNL